MSNFNAEDYRQPSDTDSEWELKKEFMDMYKYIFDEEKLLCLAQAYCDIVLKKSRYPDPVVKVITELSKPLKRYEQLLENNGNPSVKRPINEHKKDSEEMNSIYKHSERPFKQMKFLANEEQANSPFSSTSTISQSSVQHFRKTYPVPLCNEQNAQMYSKSEQISKTPVEHSGKSCKQMKFSANEGQTSSTFLSTLTNILQPSVKRFNSTHSKPSCNEQNSHIYSKLEQVLKTPVEHSEKSCKQMNFSANEGQTSSAILSTLTNMLQPSVKQFNSTHSKPLYNEQNSQTYSKSEQVLKTPVEHSEKSCKQMNFSANEGQASSAFLSTLTNMLQPSVKQFNSTHSKPLYNEQNSQTYSKPEQVLKTPVEHSGKSCKQMNFSANEGQASSAFLSTLTNMLHPSVKQFNSTHSKPLYNEQNSQTYSKSEQVLKTPVEHSGKSCKQMNFSANDGQASSAFLSTLTDMLQPSVKQFNSTHSKPLYNPEGAQSLSISKQTFNAPAEYSEKSFKQENVCGGERQLSQTILSTFTDVFFPLVEQYKNISSVVLSNEQGAQSLSKSENAFKTHIEHSEGPPKQIDFWASQKQSTSSFLPSSTNLLQPSVEQFKNANSILSYNEKSSLSLSKLEQTLKVPSVGFERPQKQINLSGIKELLGSNLLPTLTNGLQSSKEQFTNTYTVPLSNEQGVQVLSKSEEAVKAPYFLSNEQGVQISSKSEESVKTPYFLSNEQGVQISSKSEEAVKAPYFLSNEQGVQILSKSEEAVKTLSSDLKKEPKFIFQIKDISIPKETEETIINALGLPFIKQFAEVVTNYEKRSTPLDVIHHASFKCNFVKEYRFEIDSDVDISTKFYSKFFLRDCLIASEIAFVKKEAKLLSAEAAINTLIKLATGERSNFSSNPVEKPEHSIDRITDSEKVFEMFSKNINTADDEPAILILKNTASLLDMEDYLAFNVTSDIVSETETEYTCKFFLNDVLVSNATDEVIQNAKDIAAELGLIKLTNLEEYEIRENELRRIMSHKNKSVTSYTSKAKNDLGKTFIINKDLFNSSMKDGMVSLERQRYKINAQKFLRNMVSETAVFCRKDFSLKVENHVSNPLYKKCVVSIGGKEVGVGVSFRLDAAKTIACTTAFINLKKKYYTLKFKDDCMEGFLVTRDQLYNREPYYKNVLKKDFIKCTKLKTWFWILDMSKEDLSNCVEGRGIGYEPKKKQKIRDIRQFTDRLEAMLKRFKDSQDYCDLLFAWDFTSKERSLMIKIVQKVGLRYQVLMKDRSRIVCVRHKYEVRKLLNYLVRHGGCNCKFELLDESETVI